MDIIIDDDNNNNNNNYYYYDNNYNNDNDNIDRYFTIFQNIKYEYNLLKIILFYLLMFHSSVYNYYKQYENFKLYIKQKYPILYDIAKNKKNLYVIYKNQKSNLKLPKNTFLVIGSKTLYKYKGIKLIVKEIINYDEKMYIYLKYLQKQIVILINGMNWFNQFYRYCLKILFNYHSLNDYTNSILIHNFNQFKHCYLSNITQNLNVIE